MQNSAQRALQECEKSFSDMIRSIERMQQEMAKLISSNKRAALNNAEGHMERLSHEISDLKRRDNDITQLSRTEDHIHFIQVTAGAQQRHLQGLEFLKAVLILIVLFTSHIPSSRIEHSGDQPVTVGSLALQSYHMLIAQTEAEELPTVSVNPYFSFGPVTKAVSEMKQHLNDFSNDELVKVAKAGE